MSNRWSKREDSEIRLTAQRKMLAAMGSSYMSIATPSNKVQKIDFITMQMEFASQVYQRYGMTEPAVTRLIRLRRAKDSAAESQIQSTIDCSPLQASPAPHTASEAARGRTKSRPVGSTTSADATDNRLSNQQYSQLELLWKTVMITERDKHSLVWLIDSPVPAACGSH